MVSSDSASHFSHLRSGADFDVARGGWIADYSDPQNFLFLFQSDNKGLNYSRYENQEFDALMRQAENELDLSVRAGLLHAAETIIIKDAPYAPLLFYTNRNLISSKLKGFQPNLIGANATRFMWITP
jgi:oligopeptide transport system substrate-binding protein